MKNKGTIEIFLPTPVSGQTLIEAVKAVAGEFYHEQPAYDLDVTGVTIGQRTPYCANYEVHVGEDFATRTINPEGFYSVLSVTKSRRSGVSRVPLREPGDEEKAINTFAMDIINQLASVLGVTTQQIVALTRKLRGKDRQGVRYLCKYCGNGDQTGKGVCSGCGQKSPTQWIDLWVS